MAEEAQPPVVPATQAAPLADTGSFPPPAAESDRADGWSFALTVVLSLSVYLFTLASNVTLEWSGILSTGARYGGGQPVPGYPAWTIYSWLFATLLPFSNIAWRIAVGSAVASALASGFVALFVSRVGTLLIQARPDFSHLKPAEQKCLRATCGVVAGMGFAVSGTVWEMAVVVDIWALSLLLFVATLGLILHWMLDVKRRRFLSGRSSCRVWCLRAARN